MERVEDGNAVAGRKEAVIEVGNGFYNFRGNHKYRVSVHVGMLKVG